MLHIRRIFRDATAHFGSAKEYKNLSSVTLNLLLLVEKFTHIRNHLKRDFALEKLKDTVCIILCRELNYAVK